MLFCGRIVTCLGQSPARRPSNDLLGSMVAVNITLRHSTLSASYKDGPECRFAANCFVRTTDFSDEYSQGLGILGSNGE